MLGNRFHQGLSVICVQEVPLRKVCKINTLRLALCGKILNYLQSQLFAG